jgi:hypothetical protein
MRNLLLMVCTVTLPSFAVVVFTGIQNELQNVVIEFEVGKTDKNPLRLRYSKAYGDLGTRFLLASDFGRKSEESLGSFDLRNNKLYFHSVLSFNR